MSSDGKMSSKTGEGPVLMLTLPSELICTCPALLCTKSNADAYMLKLRLSNVRALSIHMSASKLH